MSTLARQPVLDALDAIKLTTWQAQALLLAIPDDKDEGFWSLSNGLQVSYLDAVVDRLRHIEAHVQAIETLALQQASEVTA
ncbi:MAG: hypothetical protein WAQ53_13580 [Thiofilum sp.]|uniref:hypothetical protein n=1 Tax=Thiofilum sp. TaxID=2212733 RepID=UPI0025DBF1BF|nr:hypothetical protein [Thiofilum sp.]MBK8453612.1 hypothetical protein [Thiofilum sp.]